MRIYLSLTKNTTTIPFNYQPFLTGAFHKWINDTSLHGRLSLYSFSWLQNVSVKNAQGINLTKDSHFFISAHDDTVIKKIIKGIIDNPAVCFGACVSDIQIIETPAFSDKERFLVASPVLVKRRFDDNSRHIVYSDPKCNEYLTETLQNKLQIAGLPADGVQVTFDEDYPAPRTKMIHYKNIGNRANVCPVIIHGTPEQIAFAWNVGIGNSTGIGFGALK